MIDILIVVALITYTISMYFIILPFLKNTDYISRLEEYDEKSKFIISNKKLNKKNDTQIAFGALSKQVSSFKLFEGYKHKIHYKLVKANLKIKAEEFVTICLMVFLLISFFVVILSGFKVASYFYSIPIGLLGWIIPEIIIGIIVKKRQLKFNIQLGDTITLISNSLKAGYSFLQAIETVTREIKGPVSEEFLMLLKEINFGQTYEKSLLNMVERVESDDLELVVTALLIQKQVGGNLSEVLDSISSTIRERIKIKGEIRTVTAQGRISGLIISLLPVILGVILFLMSPEHIMILFTDPYGIGILVTSIILEFIGIMMIKKIVNIEV